MTITEKKELAEKLLKEKEIPMSFMNHIDLEADVSIIDQVDEIDRIGKEVKRNL